MPDTKKGTVTDEQLAKSIEKLSALLDKEPGEDVEKAVIGTDGGLQGETPSDGDINKDILPDEQEKVQDPLEAVNPDKPKVNETEPLVTAGAGDMAKSEATSEKKEVAEEEEEWTEEDEQFAKALVAAFEDDTVREESLSNEFAKSLTACTIEGLSITHSELSKSLSAIEERQSSKIEQLAKSLAVMAEALAAIKKEVVTVSNTPIRATPKSAQYVAKSFGGESQGTPLSKSQIAEVLAKRVNEGKLNLHTLVKFESAGEIDPALLAEIQQTGSGR